MLSFHVSWLFLYYGHISYNSNKLARLLGGKSGTIYQACSYYELKSWHNSKLCIATPTCQLLLMLAFYWHVKFQPHLSFTNKYFHSTQLHLWQIADLQQSIQESKCRMQCTSLWQKQLNYLHKVQERQWKQIIQVANIFGETI